LAVDFIKTAMIDALKHWAELAAATLEIIGIIIILLFVIISTFNALFQLFKKSNIEAYKTYRHQLAKGILLGLEVLVAADIIHTVAVDLSLNSIAVLGLVVLIRTFLSFTLEVEISGKWPWQHG
jgi:uncharacterized membrane protein